MKKKRISRSLILHLLEASKPPEGAGAIVGSMVAAGTMMGTTGTEAGIGGVGEGKEPRASKPDSRRSFWRGARAGAMAGARAGARVRAGAAVGARLGEISPG